jgi:phospholipid/cholesterol/gamma-HCH transport system permease protein
MTLVDPTQELVVRVRGAGSAAGANVGTHAGTSTGNEVVEVQGPLTLANGPELRRQLQHADQQMTTGPVQIDVHAVAVVDGAGVVLLQQFAADCRARLGGATFVGASERLQRLLDLYAPDAADESSLGGHHDPTSGWLHVFFDSVGGTVVGVQQQVVAGLAFFGASVAAVGQAIRQPRTVNWRAIPGLVQRAGADGLMIVALTNILIGAIMAFQGAVQLQRFGAMSMTPIMVTIAHLRELGPIMTAFIVAGRSGAGFAAELGTMKVNEEIDALSTMGLDPMPWLVLPRAIALVIILPLLAVIGDICGLAGGFIATVAMVDGMTWSAYWDTVADALLFRHFSTGIFKTFVFALAIAALACGQGLAARGGAAAVGVRTTAAVVYSLFAVVVLDCIFALIFAWLGV